MRDRVCSVLLHSGHVQSFSDNFWNLREYKFKEGKRRRKTLPPSDSIQQAYVQCDASPLFGAVISYDPPQNSSDYPMNAMVEVSVDGRAIDVWPLNAGERILLENGCSLKVLDRLIFSTRDKENSESGASNSYFGTIDFTFWRGDTIIVMKSDNYHDSDYFPDEGVPALAIFTFHYRNNGWLTSRGYLKDDVKLKNDCLPILDNKVVESHEDTFRFQNQDKIDVLECSETQEIRNSLGSINRKRVTVYVHDTKGILFKKMGLNIDKNIDTSILYGSLKRIMKYLELDSSNLQIEAITHDGARLQDLKTLDIDSINGFYIF